MRGDVTLAPFLGGHRLVRDAVNDICLLRALVEHPQVLAQKRPPLPTGSWKTLDPSDDCHAASSAKNSDEKQVAVIQRKAKTKTREQGKSNQLP